MLTAFWASILGVLGGIWPALVGGTAAVVFIYVWKRWFATEGNKYGKYMPYVIQAVRLAEKYIPNKDDEAAEDTALNKADLALQKFIELYEENENATASEELQNWFKRVKEMVLLELQKHKSFSNPDNPDNTNNPAQ